MPASPANAASSGVDPMSGGPRFADVLVDIQAKTLGGTYTYSIPEGMDVEVGCAVKVKFGSRPAVGFVFHLMDEPQAADGGAAQKARPIDEVLTGPLFSAASVEVAKFLSSRYIAPLPSCIRLFFPAEAAPKMRRMPDGSYEAVMPKAHQAEEEWVLAGPEIDAFKPRKNARRQIVILDAVREAPVRRSELRFLYGEVGSTLKSLEKAGAIKLERRRRIRHAEQVVATYASTDIPEQLTECQSRAMDVVASALDDPEQTAVLIDGVTGSGKTEIYLRAIERILSRGQSAIVLVPEISLTPQTVARFRGRFGDQVAVMHSKMSQGERYDQWDMIRLGAARIVVGARSALFMPVQNLGLIVIDEEHETTYKQESAPRYVTRDVACWMAKRRRATVILGSATPSIESLFSAKHEESWSYARLAERANGRPLPKIEVVDMAQEFRGGGRQVFSSKLTRAMLDELAAGHKVVMLLNQRGFARFLLCRDCGFVPECQHCSTTLTYHESGHKLVCHHCGFTIGAPPVCPQCQSPYLKRFGVGTQRVEAEIRGILSAEAGLKPGIAGPAEQTIPDVIRMDADTTSAKGAHQRLLEQFASADAAVLLGTQMIAKGLDFDDVTLVGIINADTMLHLPDFRASERTFDLIQQVAGRAGRAELPGRVIAQSYEADSVAIRAAAAYDRQLFLRNELPKREALSFPPYARMANVLLWGHSLKDVRQAAKDYQAELDRQLSQTAPELEVLSASPCAIERVSNLYRWHIVVKGPAHVDISAALGPIHRKRPAVRGVNTAVDVDPMDLL